MLLARVDEYGRGAWLLLSLLASWITWPLGFVVFALLVGSGRLRAWRAQASLVSGRWSNFRAPARKAASWSNDAGFSGNNAFDAYCKAVDRLEQGYAYAEGMRRGSALLSALTIPHLRGRPLACRPRS